MTREEARQGLQGYSLFIADGTDLKEALNLAIESLSADEVVRCKDCRHAEHRKQMPNQVYCHRDSLSTFCAVHDDDDFCKYGERREECD